MTSVETTCAWCEFVAVGRSESDLMRSGWELVTCQGDETLMWRCSSCVPRGEDVGTGRHEEPAEIERALREAYDLETIERFAKLLTDLREQGRIVPDLSRIGQCVVGVLEAAVPAPHARGLGNAACGRVHALLNPQYR